MKNQFISVDWGTSNFRLRLVETSSLKILEEVKSSQGIKATYLKWLDSERERESFYLAFLEEQISKLTSPISPDCQIVISGMSSSSIGLRELPYAPLPFQLDAKGLAVETIIHDQFPYIIKLISGVKNQADVIRGEEVQLIGLAANIDQLRPSVYILPGTHSKHIYCKNGSVVDFKTYMTGEVFDVISKNTILAGSINKGEFETREEKAFLEGVEKANSDESILAQLFRIRAWDLFQEKTPSENYYYLSGLLIGDELSGLSHQNNYHAYLGVPGELARLYEMAASILKINYSMIDETEMRNAVIKGQAKVLAFL